MNKKILKICFVMPEIYPLVDNSINGHSGGSESQMFQLANALSKMGNLIFLVVGDYGQPKRSIVSGFDIFSIRNRKGIKPWRIFKSIIDIFSALLTNKPDVVIHQNFGYFHGINAICCKLLGIPYVYFTASEADVDGTRYRTCSRPIAWLWRFGVKITPTIIVQANEHKELLLKNFYKDSIVIPNGINTKNFTRTREHGDFILWVAHWRQVKRPDIVAELALRLPNFTFIMCGGFYDKELYQRIVTKFPKNVIIQGHANDSELMNAYQDAILLINTSDYEGIPVTFDEAWACELPVVSLNVDPDGVIKRHSLGFISKTTDQMVLDIKYLCENKRKTAEIGLKCRDFVVKNHNIDIMSELIINILYLQCSKN
jgi:glycosyltransferase involved in cell wall biosynthesis